VAQEIAMQLISATSSELLSAVVNSADLSERHTDETHRYLQRRDGERPVELSETLKALASALFPIAASGD
jgi:hypothetical protein